MKVKSFVLMCVFAGLAMGCDSGKDTAVDAAPQPEVAAESEVSAPTCLQGEGYDRLPSDVCVHRQFGFRATRHYQDKQGRDRTRVTFAYENGVDNVVESMGSAFTSAGYRMRERENKADGSILVPFTKGDAGTTYLEIKPLSDGDAAGGGTFFVDFRDAPTVPSQAPAD